MNNEYNNQGGIGFFGLLTILLIGLKLTGYIDWAWYWIFAPIWVPIVIVIGLMILVAGIKYVISKFKYIYVGDNHD